MTAHAPTDGRPGDEQVRPGDGATAGATRPVVEINEALRNDWIEIWYQPKIDLRRKCLAGAEALARIRHPGLGELPKGSFLPRFDADGIAALTERALIETLRNWADFDAAGVNLHLAINVPVGALFKLPILTLVREHRPTAAHWPGLILEVAEDQIVRDISAAHAVATELRESGITISIDEFGAGYSSFSSLRELPFAELKLDRSFVKNCAGDATNAVICQTAIDLAHRFGGAAVANGLDNPADLQAMMVMRCDFGQGALVGPPMPKEQFLDMLRKRMNRAATPTEAAPVGDVA
jgi:EAL domain-containing protein (putative c-di-GMP-specific phosphodiesterase class I)